MLELDNARIGVIGLGYVGLPLAVAFGGRFETVGFDVKGKRIAELRGGHDSTREVEPAVLASAGHLTFADDPEDLRDCNVYIVTVPTPIDAYKKPDLGALISASETVGRVIGKGDVVVYESTVYPGATEDDCLPVVERVSGLELNRDFYAGYSPERMNPGDREHGLARIVKVTSGSTPDAARFIDALYGCVVEAGTHLASSIRVAEAAKVIENIQRDVNIALVNDLAVLFDRLGLDTEEVLTAARTKWNFLPFRPGLVGGHCIGIDPYYLTHKAQAVGHHPEMILAGRRINDAMGGYVASRVVKLMTRRGLRMSGARILILGLAFKENCPDLRNTRVVDIIAELRDYGAGVEVHDPFVDRDEAREEYGIDLSPMPGAAGSYDAVILAVAHEPFGRIDPGELRRLLKSGGVLFDIKHLYPRDAVDGRL
jgi:UDP-N-acetyl-D-glucosamine/UDP-N-acetyl-D-galactosamine dehydrogenase